MIPPEDAPDTPADTSADTSNDTPADMSKATLDASTAHEARATPTLLAVDLGLRTGLAVFGRDGRLLRYRSTHFPDLGTLKRALPRVLTEAPNLACLVCEGDRHLAAIWTRHLPRDAELVWVSAETWREGLLTPAEQRDGPTAKQSADRRAREVIAASGLSRPTSLRHDAAEAILIGLWGALRLGWCERPPWRRR